MSILEQLFRVKDLNVLRAEAAADQPNALKRTLTVKDLVAFGLGAVIGSGIFVTAGLAAAGSGGYIAAGPSVIVSFVLVAVACLLCVLCYAEFSSIIPAAGSAYTYAYATLGEYIAWILGWNLILEYVVGNVAVAISWSSYLNSVLSNIGIHIPDYLLVSFFQASPEVIASAPHIFGIPIVFNFPAAAIPVLLAYFLVHGIKESSTLNNFLVIFKIGIVLFLVCAGAFYINPDNWHPFAPNGLAGIQSGAAIIFFAYIGFDAITTVAEETENPSRDLPLGMVITLALSTLLYVLVALVMTGMVPYQELGTASPMARAFELVNVPWAAMIISVGALVSMTAVLFVFQVATPRIFFVMSRDGLIPKVFSKVHQKYRTPYVTTYAVTALISLAAGFIDLSVVIELCNVGTLFAFILVCIGVIVLRKTRPDLPRPFKTPYVPWVPIGGILSCLYLCGGMPYTTWIRFFVWIFIGTIVYFFYGLKNSGLNKKAVEKAEPAAEKA